MRSIIALALVVLAVSCQSTQDATSRLEAALDAMDRTATRIEMSTHAEMRGSAALGGSYSQDMRAVGVLVPPDRLHLLLDGAGILELVMIEHRMWVDQGSGLRLASGVPLGPLAEAQAPLDFVRGPGIPRFAGFGMSRGVLTYRIRLELDAFDLAARMRSDAEVDPDTVGVLEIEVGLFDGLVRRQSVEVIEPVDPFSGSGVSTVRTAYTIEYWDHGADLEVPEPK